MSARPWTAGEWYSHRVGWSSVYIESPIGGGQVQEIAVCGPTAFGTDQQDANARLISAAPDLAEALIAATKFLTWCIEQTPLGPAPMTGPEALEQARAALAKAGVE